MAEHLPWPRALGSGGRYNGYVYPLCDTGGCGPLHFWPREHKAEIPIAASFKTAPDKVPSCQDLMSEMVSAVCHPQSVTRGHRDEYIALCWLTYLGPHFCYLLSVCHRDVPSPVLWPGGLNSCLSGLSWRQKKCLFSSLTPGRGPACCGAMTVTTDWFCT